MDQKVFYDIGQLDRPSYLQNKMHLTELSDEGKENLRNEGYGEKTLEAIRSEEEADIYNEAGLESKEINGRECLVRSDIDYEQIDDRGRTNLERMEKGLSPLDKDGQPFELHHIGQKMDAPLAELTKKEHIADGNYNILHESKESEISRPDFNKERADHWKARAAEIKQERAIT
ncbi:hypothetical protein F7P75_10035 [Acinetobacter gandensis]|nr:hypothetical protein F7P75_10035 [Acinetobacter gandensis]